MAKGNIGVSKPEEPKPGWKQGSVEPKKPSLPKPKPKPAPKPPER